jgi:hypothetical protein
VRPFEHTCIYPTARQSQPDLSAQTDALDKAEGATSTFPSARLDTTRHQREAALRPGFWPVTHTTARWIVVLPGRVVVTLSRRGKGSIAVVERAYCRFAVENIGIIYPLLTHPLLTHPKSSLVLSPAFRIMPLFCSGPVGSLPSSPLPASIVFVLGRYIGPKSPRSTFTALLPPSQEIFPLESSFRVKYYIADPLVLMLGNVPFI